MTSQVGADFSPFSNPAARRKQETMARVSYKAFNSVAGLLLKDLSRIFPSDATLRLISGKFGEVCDDKAKYTVPAGAFFGELRKKTVRVDPESGRELEYIDLLVRHDEKAFEDPIPVAMLQGIGLAKKWNSMDPELRQAVWVYVDKLVKLSSQAVMYNSHAFDQKNALGRAAINAALAGHTSEAALASDPAVSACAQEFVDSLPAAK